MNAMKLDEHYNHGFKYIIKSQRLNNLRRKYDIANAFIWLDQPNIADWLNNPTRTKRYNKDDDSEFTIDRFKMIKFRILWTEKWFFTYSRVNISQICVGSSYKQFIEWLVFKILLYSYQLADPWHPRRASGNLFCRSM